MEQQMSLLEFDSPDQKEFLFLTCIKSQLENSIIEHGGKPDLLAFKPTKVDMKSSSSGYTSVFFHTFTAFRLHLRGKQHYISLPTVFSDLIPEGYPRKQMASDPKYLRILIDNTHPFEFYSNFLIRIVGETVNRYPKEWSCCSRYMECSDAKTCIHPDKAFALGCGYRRVLNSGRIFYGKNRNID